MAIRYAAITAISMAIAVSAHAQSPQPPVQPTANIQVSTQLVVLDVIITDHNGTPVHGLKREDFVLSEKKSPQVLRSFEEHTSASAQTPGPAIPKLPPGTFTNYTPVAPNGTLNILLLDTLNTPTKDQSFVRTQLKQYVDHANPGTRIAIFGLTTHLTMLQSFTSDPETLKDAVSHKLIPRGSALLADPTGNNSNPESLSDQTLDLAAGSSAQAAASLTQIAANLAQFEAETSSFQTNMRAQYTLDAFNTLAHYLAGFSGRKNLLWFSGAFPLSILPDPTVQDPFAVMQSSEDEYRETITLLTQGQVAVYPIDARGLMTSPVFDAANSGSGYARNPSRMNADNAKFNNSLAEEHMTMARLADDTGGHAFYNTNGLADAVAKAIESGSNYYTLTYTPTEHRADGSFRSIHVDLAGAAAARGLKLSYRPGYYAASHADSPGDTAGALPGTTQAPSTAAQTTLQHARAAYAHAAMARGAPAPQDILFKVRVLPSSAEPETTLAPGNVADPYSKVPGPYQRFAVDYATLPSYFNLDTQPDGKRSGGIEFMAYVYDSNGRLLNTVSRSIALNLSPETYQRFLKSSLQIHLEVSSPIRKETYLRVAVRDLSNNRFGVVELPTSTVAHLPPPPPNPAATPSTPPPASPTPSTPPR